METQLSPNCRNPICHRKSFYSMSIAKNTRNAHLGTDSSVSSFLKFSPYGVIHTLLEHKPTILTTRAKSQLEGGLSEIFRIF